MPGAARKGIDSAGGTIIGGAGTVIVNGAPVARQTDGVAGHGKAPHSSPVMIGASGTVFAEGLPISREGDKASCGHSASGSGDVIVGD